ncbi:hypothetical protein VXN63_06010 [Marinilactibacillus sp. XAAS-LB27]|uniref:hypothetical protein n=1 Tax=Marinilactibacillus sp. XAAS-LB27 TaxID=3114538 RepID=UPI002E16F62F|nr:hypothetical protein [Marinilactibacillus sp. XAAS-LB27]
MIQRGATFILERGNPFKWVKFSILTHTVFAIIKILTSIVSFSIFLFIHAFYNIMIVRTKYLVFNTHRDENQQSLDTEKVYKVIGYSIVAISFIFMVYCIRLFHPDYNMIAYPKFVGISVVVFTVVELMISISGIVTARMERDVLAEGLKFINMTSSLISIHLSQLTLVSFTNTNYQVSIYIGISGYMIGLVILGMGLFMIKRAARFQSKIIV